MHGVMGPEDGSAPNSGPTKVPGVYAVNDIVKLEGSWSFTYYVREVVSPELVYIERDCGCGGWVLKRIEQLMHLYHAANPPA